MKRAATAADQPAHLEQHYDRRDLAARGIRLSRTTLWRRIRAGTFPAPIDIGGRHVWPESAIRAWLASCPRPGAPIERHSGEAAR